MAVKIQTYEPENWTLKSKRERRLKSIVTWFRDPWQEWQIDTKTEVTTLGKRQGC